MRTRQNVKSKAIKEPEQKPTPVKVIPDCKKCSYYKDHLGGNLVNCQHPLFSIPHPNCSIWRVPCVYYKESK